jgi:hypothetical protein
MKRSKILSAIILLSVLYSCSKEFLEKKPESTDTQINSDEAIKAAQDLRELLNSVYDVAANLYGGQAQNLMELLGDDVGLPVSQTDYLPVYYRKSDIFNGTIGGRYKDAYLSIYRANVLIMKKDEVSEISEAEKIKIEAEARFLRALNHHAILRMFAQPPGFTANNSHPGIVMRMKYSQDAGVRSTMAECLALILSDLDFAEQNLPDDNGAYATKWSAKALKARFYLDQNKFAEAAQFAGEVLNSGKFALLDSLNRFTAGANSEQIFYTVSTFVQDKISDERGGDFLRYRSDNNDNPSMRASEELYNFIAFDTLDKRKDNWFRVIDKAGIVTYAVKKFDRSFMWIPILHLTEMKLTRAEALAALGTDVSTALNDLNEIRHRAGLDSLSGISGVDLVNAIRDERRKEMCFEGDRTMQIKRKGVLGYDSQSRGAIWNCPGMVLQFPGAENSVIGFQLNPTGGCE